MAQQKRFKNIPSECKMPDLSDLYTPLKSLLIVQFLVGEGDLSRNVSLYRRNFVHLLDKALEEYGEARKAILDQIEEKNRSPEKMAQQGRSIYMLAFTDHIETCINAASRLHKLLKRIEKESPEFPVELLERIKTQVKSVNKIRNAIEHMDERISNGKIATGQPIMLALSGEHDGVAVSSHEIKFEELAMVLRTLHEIALYILKAKKQNS